MRTEFGIHLRKLRAIRDETMTQMAARVGRTPSFLSAVEVGKKEPPAALIEDLIEKYNLDADAADQMLAAADSARTAFVLQPKDAFARDTASLMARRLDGLSKDQLLSIQQILKGQKN